MKTTRLFWILLLTLVSAGMLSEPLALGAEQVASERRLPPQVYAFVSVPSVAEMKQRWNQSSMGRLLQDEDLDEFLQDVKDQFDQLATDFSDKTGIELQEVLDIPSGDASVAVLQTGGNRIGVVGLLDFGEERETVDRLLETASENWVDAGAERSVEDVGDTTIIIHTFPADDAKAENQQDGTPGGNDDEKERTVAYFIKDTHIVGGSNVPAVREVLARWDGEHPQTFAENEEYTYIIDRCKTGDSNPVFTWYVNPVGLVEQAIASAGQGNPQMQMFRQFIPILGLGNLKALGGVTQIATGEFDLVGRTLLYVDSPTSGLLNVFLFPSTEQAPPAWVSTSVSSYFGMNWDIVSAYSAVESIVDSFQGPGTFEQMIDRLAEQETGPNIHLKRDVIDQLTGSVHVARDYRDPNDIQTERVLVAFGVKNADNVKSVLQSVADQPAIPLESRQFRGETLYEFEAGTTLDGSPRTFAIGVAKDHLLITNDVTRFEDVVRSEGSARSLAESPDYRKISAEFPNQTSMIGFQKQATQMQAAYDMLRSGEVAEMVEGIDLSKLPPFEDIKEYFHPSGSFAVPDQHGALMVSFTLKSESP